MCSEDFSFARLMDLGVIKPIAASGITDDDGPHFIGTHQYSPPEFLAREERDDPEGWRAITFYQLGAVLHDLIMRRELFAEESHVHGRLITAVKEKVPQVFASDVDPRLVLLTQNCLHKDPAVRLKLVDWNSFAAGSLGAAENAWTDEALRERVQRRREARAMFPADVATANHELDACRDLRERVEELARSEGTDKGALPPARITSASASTNRFNVKIDCPPSPNDALDMQLTFRLEVTILDPATRAVSVEAFASVGGSPHAPCDSVVLFKGVLSDGIVRSAMSRLFLVGLDLAQAKSAGCNHETVSEWLPLKNAWEAPIG